MKYFVILGDGRRFGPADVQTLNHWIAEKRLTHESMLEEEVSGQQQKAVSVTGLVFPESAPQSVMQPRPDTLATNPFDPLSQPQGPVTQRPEFAQAASPKSSPFASAPQPVTSYPRAGYGAMSGDLPHELQKRFCWGAFFFTWIWGINHRSYWMLWILLVGLIPCGSLVFGIICGNKGYEEAWKSGRFSTVQECIECQKIWGFWALGVFLFTFIGYIIFFIFSLSSG